MSFTGSEESVHHPLLGLQTAREALVASMAFLQNGKPLILLSLLIFLEYSF